MYSINAGEPSRIVAIDFTSPIIRIAIRQGDDYCFGMNPIQGFLSDVLIDKNGLHTSEDRTESHNDLYISDICSRLNESPIKVKLGDTIEKVPITIFATALFKAIKEDIEQETESIEDAILTVPLDSNFAYRDALIKSARAGGFNIISVVSQDVAAAYEFLNVTNRKNNFVPIIQDHCTLIMYCLHDYGYFSSIIEICNNKYTVKASCSKTITREEAEMDPYLELIEESKEIVDAMTCSTFKNSDDKYLLYMFGSKINNYDDELKNTFTNYSVYESNNPIYSIPIGALEHGIACTLGKSNIIQEIHDNNKYYNLPHTLYRQNSKDKGKCIKKEKSPYPSDLDEKSFVFNKQEKLISLRYFIGDNDNLAQDYCIGEYNFKLNKKTCFKATGHINCYGNVYIHVKCPTTPSLSTTINGSIFTNKKYIRKADKPEFSVESDSDSQQEYARFEEHCKFALLRSEYLNEYKDLDDLDDRKDYFAQGLDCTTYEELYRYWLEIID